MTKDSATWVATVCGQPHLVGTLAKYGFETTFAIGLLTSAAELSNACGLWIDDAKQLFAHIQGPRLLVQRWSPFLTRIPTDTSVSQFLQSTPVPLLALRSTQLATHGFECLAALKNISQDDCLSIGISYGHALALHHIALMMNDPGVMPKTISLPLEVWLGNLSPPMGHYAELIRLVRPDITSTESLLTLKLEDVNAMLIELGHKKALWNYVVKSRTYWWDSL